MPSQREKGFLIIGFGVIVLVCVLYLLFVTQFAYSDGERAGYMQKLSHKGWICKTYEGELAMTTVPGIAPTLWHFTVREENVAKQLNTLMGKQVVLTYEEHIGIPTTCYGDTRYFVTSVKAVN